MANEPKTSGGKKAPPAKTEETLPEMPAVAEPKAELHAAPVRRPSPLARLLERQKQIDAAKK